MKRQDFSRTANRNVKKYLIKEDIICFTTCMHDSDTSGAGVPLLSGAPVLFPVFRVHVTCTPALVSVMLCVLCFSFVLFRLQWSCPSTD